jgi:hypothetical protein
MRYAYAAHGLPSRAKGNGDGGISDDESLNSDMSDEDCDDGAAPEEISDQSLGHNLPKREMRKLYDEMDWPWKKQYRRIMRKKPRKIYLQITQGDWARLQ